MKSSEKVLQYVKEARASELALVRVLQSQIAMTPSGTLRSGLEAHLRETQDHADRLRDRARELQNGFNPVALAFGVAEAMTGQALALAKSPVDLVRGTGGEEKVLKNAKDAAATEALEIATYTALERLAELADDTKTAELAASIREDEERMLESLLGEIPALTEAVYAADVKGEPSFDVTETGAADAVRGVTGAVDHAVDDMRSRVKGGARFAESVARAGLRKGRRAANDAQETASEAADMAEGAAKDVAEAAEATVKGAAGRARSTAKDAAGTAKDAADEAQATAKDAASKTRSTAKSTAGTAKRAAGAAKTTAKDAASTAKSTAAAAVGEAEATAEDAAGSAKAAAESVASGAKDAADTTKAAAKDAADGAKATAKTAGKGAKATAKDTAAGAKATAKDTAAGAKATAKDAADGVKATARDTAAGAKATAKTAKDGASATAEDAADDVRETVAETAREIAEQAETTGVEVELPWPGYDELTVEQIRAVLLTADAEKAGRVTAYEQANKGRTSVLEAAGRLAHAN